MHQSCIYDLVFFKLWKNMFYMTALIKNHIQPAAPYCKQDVQIRKLMHVNLYKDVYKEYLYRTYWQSSGQLRSIYNLVSDVSWILKNKDILYFDTFYRFPTHPERPWWRRTKYHVVIQCSMYSQVTEWVLSRDFVYDIAVGDTQCSFSRVDCFRSICENGISCGISTYWLLLNGHNSC